MKDIKNYNEKKRGYWSKPVRCIELNTIYPSAAEAARQLNLDPATIRKVCRGERRRTGGYHWEFVKEEKYNDDEEV